MLTLLTLLSVVAFSGCGKKYTVTFDARGGYLVEGEVVQTVSKPTSLVPPVFGKDGYSFVGWDVTLDSINTDMTVNAVWKVAEYTITYDLDGGSPAEANPSKYTIFSQTFKLNPPKRTGYEFTGWTGTNLNGKVKDVVIPEGSFGDRVYTANWEVVKYPISYDLGGGKIKLPNPYQFDITSENLSINNPEREGYDFVGWTGSGVDIPTTNLVVDTKTVGEKHYVANWTPKTYKISFADEEGNLLGIDDFNVRYTCKVGESDILPTIQKEGKVFIGWYYNGEMVTEETVYNLTNDITVNACFGDQYLIKFSLIYQYKGFNPDGEYVDHPILFVYNKSETPPESIQATVGSTVDTLPTVVTHPMYGQGKDFKFICWVYYTASGEEKEFTIDTVLEASNFPYAEIVLYPKGTYAYGPTITG